MPEPYLVSAVYFSFIMVVYLKYQYCMAMTPVHCLCKKQY